VPDDLREPEVALLERVKRGDLRNLSAVEVELLASLRQRGVVTVQRSGDTTPDTWSVVGAETPKRSRAKK
jgi:hypothetical protein